MERQRGKDEVQVFKYARPQNVDDLWSHPKPSPFTENVLPLPTCLDSVDSAALRKITDCGRKRVTRVRRSGQLMLCHRARVYRGRMNRNYPHITAKQQ